MKRSLAYLFAWGLLAAGFFASTTNVLAQTYPAGAVGSYEGQLLTLGSGLPYGKIEFTVPVKGNVTGKVFAPDKKSYGFSKALTVSGDSASATAMNAIILAKTAGVARFSLNLTVNADGTFSAGGLANLPLVGGGYYLDTDSAIRVKKITGKGTDVAEWAGAYSFAFNPSESSAGAPSGFGYASAVIDAKGVMSFKGKLADGTIITGKANPSEDASYLLFVAPYAKGGYFKAVVDLDEVGESGRYRVTNGEIADAAWQKLVNTADKAYPNGFGPLVLDLSGEAWIKPPTGQTIASLLGAVGKQINFSLEGVGLDADGAYLGQFPAKLEINAKNELVPVFGDVYAPTTAAAWAKLWKVKINPATGVYTGTLNLRDLIQSPATGEGRDTKYTPVKFLNRKLTIEGVLLRDFNDALEPFRAVGYFLLPPVNAKTDTTKAGGTVASGPLEPVGTGGPVLGAISPGTPGNYTTVFSKEVQFDFGSFASYGGFSVSVTGSLKNIPEANAIVPFTIAPDLSYIIFNGRKLPLVGDSRPVALVFSDASAKNYKNVQTVTAYLNNTTGKVTSVGGLYVQYLTGSITIPGGTYNGITIKAQTVKNPLPGLVFYTGSSVIKTL